MLAPDKAMDVLRKYMLVDGFDVLIDFDRSRGNTVVDARTGTAYLDMFSMVASQPLGFNHPALSEEPFRSQLLSAAINNTTNSDIYNAHAATFVDTFMSRVAPSYMKHLFLVAGGTLGVENAVKIAIDWKVRKNFGRGCKEERGQQVIHFRECFHGRSGYALMMTNTDPNKTRYFPRFPWPRITNPKITFPLEGENLKEVTRLEQQALSEIKKAITDNKDDIAALIIEPIQGEGGDNHFRPEFFRALRQVCDESEIFFIVDEVQTGIGLTGKMWGFEHYGVKPDAVTFGKKTQVCGVVVGPRVDEVADNAFKVSSRINSTWGGNNVDMVRATKYFEVIERDKLVDQVAALGTWALSRLGEMQKESGGALANARGRGLFMAIDLADPDLRPELLRRTFANGMLVLPSGSRSIRFRPSLNTTKEELQRAFEILARSLKEAGAARPVAAA